jgi:excisionase family DNA binding protein
MRKRRDGRDTFDPKAMRTPSDNGIYSDRQLRADDVARAVERARRSSKAGCEAGRAKRDTFEPEPMSTPSDNGIFSDRLLRADDVARLLGMTPKWVYDETRKGRIPHVKLGRFYRYRESAIGRWLAALEGEEEVTNVIAA